MQIEGRWLQSLTRKFVRDNKFTPLAADSVVMLKPTMPPNIRLLTNFTSQGILVFKDTDSNYVGSEIVSWGGCNIALFFKNVTPEIWVYNPNTKRELADALIKRYGLPFEKEWFEDGPVDCTVLPIQTKLKTLTNHFLVGGVELEITVNRGVADLTEILKDAVLESPGWPITLATDRTSAEYSYSLDLTPGLPEDYRLLGTYPAGMMDEVFYEHDAVKLLVSLINQRSEQMKASFSTAVAGDFNFKNSEMVFNGRPRNFVHPEGKPWSPGTDVRYDRVLVIRFDTSAPGRGGYAFFHYYEVS